MFSDNKKSKMATESISTQNIIAADTKIVGDIVSKGPFRIDGQVEGNIKTRDKIVVGKSGFVNGTIDGTNADFEGSFSGKLIVWDAVIKIFSLCSGRSRGRQISSRAWSNF